MAHSQDSAGTCFDIAKVVNSQPFVPPAGTAVELVPQPERRGTAGGEDGGARGGGDTDAPQPTPSLSPAGAPQYPTEGLSGHESDKTYMAS